MTEHSWRVVPLSRGQLLDVRPEDVLESGLYRRCSTYRGGGGYDRFPYLAAKRVGGHPDAYAEQFVVQVHGCNLDCPYCYVTRAGVWDEAIRVGTSELVAAFAQSGLPVFHLMGGAPALQLPWWGELITELQRQCPEAVFHSDLMLTERPYSPLYLQCITRPRCLYAINIKGLTPGEYSLNTRMQLDEELLWGNWRAVQSQGVPSYVTFTGADRDGLEDFWRRADKQRVVSDWWRIDAFVIDIIDDYNATPHVDDVAWGGR